jgi:hypothetical protein
MKRATIDGLISALRAHRLELSAYTTTTVPPQLWDCARAGRPGGIKRMSCGKVQSCFLDFRNFHFRKVLILKIGAQKINLARSEKNESSKKRNNVGASVRRFPCSALLYPCHVVWSYH